MRTQARRVRGGSSAPDVDVPQPKYRTFVQLVEWWAYRPAIKNGARGALARTEGAPSSPRHSLFPAV